MSDDIANTCHMEPRRLSRDEIECHFCEEQCGKSPCLDPSIREPYLCRDVIMKTRAALWLQEKLLEKMTIPLGQVGGTCPHRFVRAWITPGDPPTGVVRCEACGKEIEEAEVDVMVVGNDPVSYSYVVKYPPVGERKAVGEESP